MKIRLLLIFIFMVSLFFVPGCDALDEMAPPPTQEITEPPPTPTPTIEPTMGEREFIDAAYCWVSHIDDAEFNIIRFFPSGELIDVYVQPYQSCTEAWEETGEYLTQENLMSFNHGIYVLSGDRIEFTLSPPNSAEVVGEVTGTYEVNKMYLLRLGSEEREYNRLEIGASE